MSVVEQRLDAFRADALAAKVPKRAWQKLSAGASAKGHRFYDRADIDLAESRLRQPPSADPPQPHHW